MFGGRGSRTFTWGNVFSSGLLPKRVFFFLVDQSSYSGAINRRPTFCEPANVSELKFQVDGRDLLPESFKPSLSQMENDGPLSFNSNVNPLVLGLNMVMNGLFKQSATAGILGELDVKSGLLIYAANLHHAQSNSPRHGSFDVHVTFRKATLRAYTAICIGEFDQVD